MERRSLGVWWDRTGVREMLSGGSAGQTGTNSVEENKGVYIAGNYHSFRPVGSVRKHKHNRGWQLHS